MRVMFLVLEVKAANSNVAVEQTVVFELYCCGFSTSSISTSISAQPQHLMFSVAIKNEPVLYSMHSQSLSQICACIKFQS